MQFHNLYIFKTVFFFSQGMLTCKNPVISLYMYKLLGLQAMCGWANFPQTLQQKEFFSVI